MEEGTKTALVIGVPLAITGAIAALYFATRGPDGLPPGCVDGESLVEVCPDGSQIVTHICQGGQWVPTGAVCPTQPEPPPECAEGDVRYEKTWEKNTECRKTSKRFQCQNERWVCTSKCGCATHPPELVNFQTRNHIYIYWEMNRVWHVEVSYRDQITGSYKTAGIPYNGSYMSRLMMLLDYLLSGGRINATQYQNGLFQGQNMGWT